MKTISIEAYDALTSQGLGKIDLNINHIVYLTELIPTINKRIKTIQTRVHLSTGQIIDVKMSKENILKEIKKS